ncbi:MAG: hypothetical protein PVF58_11575 [Candidatus Methanofastidiosia archaeon]|jgi:hypothetical protein
MEKIEKEHFTIEIYYNYISKRLIVGMVFMGAASIFFFLFLIIGARKSMLFTSVLIIYIGFFLLLVFLAIGVKKMHIILTRDAFIQMELKGVIPWEDIDHVEYHLGKNRKTLTIYYQKHDQLQRFVTSLDAIEEREQFLKSLKEFSKMYGFLIEEK